MRILLIHNNYGTFSGEEAVVEKQIGLFQSAGHEVMVFRRDSSRYRSSLLGNIKGFFSAFYSFSSIREIKNILKTYKPHVAVVHNLYPFISPAILKHIRKAGVPIVMTVHNYRLICPTGLFMRNSRPCELCLGGSEWNCIKHNCELSLPRSVGYAARNWYARKTRAYKNNISLYACITEFQTKKLIEADYGREKMRVIPNFSDKINPYQEITGNYVAISGRLSKEKGIDLILKVAKRTPGISYIFAGSKRESDVWEEEIPANCTFLGHLSGEALTSFYMNSKFLLIGSLCYEGFPMTILEASSQGKPTIGPGHAGFPEIIGNGTTGLLFSPGDADDMEEKVSKLWNDDGLCYTMGRNAYSRLKSAYSGETAKDKWQQLLKELVQHPEQQA